MATVTLDAFRFPPIFGSYLYLHTLRRQNFMISALLLTLSTHEKTISQTLTTQTLLVLLLAGWLAGTASFHTEQEQTVNKYAARKTAVLLPTSYLLNTVWECFAWRLHPRHEIRLERLLLLACLLGKFVSLGTLVEQL